MPTVSKAFERYAVHWVALDPARGSELRKTRPAVIVSLEDRSGRLLGLNPRSVAQVLVGGNALGGRRHRRRSHRLFYLSGGPEGRASARP